MLEDYMLGTILQVLTLACPWQGTQVHLLCVTAGVAHQLHLSSHDVPRH